MYLNTVSDVIASFESSFGFYICYAIRICSNLIWLKFIKNNKLYTQNARDTLLRENMRENRSIIGYMNQIYTLICI